MKPMEININKIVSVTLTEQGATILNRSIYNYGHKEWKHNDIYSSELWLIMAIFGEHLYNGCDIPFVNNKITIDDDRTL